MVLKAYISCSRTVSVLEGLQRLQLFTVLLHKLPLQCLTSKIPTTLSKPTGGLKLQAK